MADKYILQDSKEKGHYICTDKINGLVYKWYQGKFNETQKVTYLEAAPTNVMEIARQQRELSEWLMANHSDKL